MNIERDILNDLQKWKGSSRRKPLILDGARQVGKTHSLQKFGSMAYENLAYFNFEKDEELSAYFEGSIQPKKLIEILSLYSGVNIEPGKTLIVFDEVQECSRALNSLKYFNEEANEYHIAAAGSQLGIKTTKSRGFPVGKVNFLHLYPLTFFEFLTAKGEDKLRVFLEKYDSFEPIPEPLHNKLIEFLKYYFYIGGMPEVVAEYISTNDINLVRDVQLEILDAYERDFAKHAPDNQFIKISTIWNQVHRQLSKENKKFIFSAIRKSVRGRDYEEAIQWLVDAGLIYKCYHASTPRVPLSAYSDHNIFKIFLLDVGLLGAQCKLTAKIIIEGDKLFTEFKGAFAENYVAQALKALKRNDLYYWTSSGIAEVDFLVEHGGTILPVEVKAGSTSHNKSLLVYAKKYDEKNVSRLTQMNLKHDGIMHNYPLYMVARLGAVENK